MKKRIIIFIAILCTIALLVTLSIFIDNASKSSKTTIDKEKKENTSENQSKSKLSKDFQERHTYYKTIKCQVLNDENIIGYIASNSERYIVTKNTVYVLDKSKLFSNDTNCKSISTESFDSDIFNVSCDWGGCSIETQNNYYSYSATDDKITKMEEDMEIYYKNFGQFSKLGNNVLIDIGTYINFEDYIFILSIDNKIKLYKPTYDNNGNKGVGEYKDINYDFKGETVKAIIDNYIKTDKAYYKISKYATNKEECKKYADIKCQYEYKIEKAKYLTENYDKIAIVSNTEIIDKEGNIYRN